MPSAASGILPSQSLRQAIQDGGISMAAPAEPGQIQPASLDLRLGDVAYRVAASFLPARGRGVDNRIQDLAQYEVPLADGAVLEKGAIYIIPLMEGLALPQDWSAIANPKSSTGRLDILSRVLTDGGSAFDHIRAGYRGPLWVEVSPRAFSIRVRRGSRLVQLRIKQGVAGARAQAHPLAVLHGARPPEDATAPPLPFSVDVVGSGPGSLIGYRAKKHAGLIDIDRPRHYRWQEYWEPVHAVAGRGLVLDPEDFYILASKEMIAVAADHAAEMVAYDTLVGEFRVHYAGFFDPGFGLGPRGERAGARAVLEVRSHEVPFLVDDGQIVGHLIYEPLLAEPDLLYGRDIGSNYQAQGLALAKQFIPPEG